jgi:hypothetical protein
VIQQHVKYNNWLNNTGIEDPASTYFEDLPRDGPINHEEAIINQIGRQTTSFDIENHPVVEITSGVSDVTYWTHLNSAVLLEVTLSLEWTEHCCS